MLTLPEKILFALAALASLFAVYRAIRRIVLTLGRGKGRPDWALLPKRLVTVLPKLVAAPAHLQNPLLDEPVPSPDRLGLPLLLAGQPGRRPARLPARLSFPGQGLPGQLHRLLADLASVSVLSGMLAMLVRRFIFRPRHSDRPPGCAAASQGALRHPPRLGHRRQLFIVHVGSRLLGQSFNLARCRARRLAALRTRLAGLWAGASPSCPDSSPSTSPSGWPEAPSWPSCPISSIPSTSTCSLPRSTSCSSRSAARSAS